MLKCLSMEFCCLVLLKQLPVACSFFIFQSAPMMDSVAECPSDAMRKYIRMAALKWGMLLTPGH